MIEALENNTPSSAPSWPRNVCTTCANVRSVAACCSVSRRLLTKAQIAANVATHNSTKTTDANLRERRSSDCRLFSSASRAILACSSLARRNTIA